MASLPPQRPQRSSQPRSETSDQTNQQTRRSSSNEFPSSTSEDSQTVLLEGPRPSAGTLSRQHKIQATEAQQNSPSPQNDDDLRRCWICFSDETEDESPRVWRTPCPCALTAHESCLLDWIGDIESPDSSHSTARSAEIKCPQCKSQIYLARPKNRLVDYVGSLETGYTRLLIPAAIAGFGYAFLLAFSHHGAHTIRTLFGDEDAARILESVSQDPDDWNTIEREAVKRFPDIFRPVLREWRGFRTELGLPLIPAALITSRTNHGDFALPFLSVLFFAMHPFKPQPLIGDSWLPIPKWPPTAALTMVLLPYIRGVYNEGMERLFGEQERAWAKEVRPRLGSEENNETNGAVDHDHEEANDDTDVEEVLRIEVDLGMDGDDEEEEEQQVSQQEAAPPAGPDQGQAQDQVQEPHSPAEDIANILDATQDETAPPLQDQAQDQQQEQQPNQQAGQPPQEPARRNNLEFSLFNTAYNMLDSAFGAMMFPTVAAASGECLKLLLPRSIVTLPAPSKGDKYSIPTGLLQTKWGRSIVGGCLFVVLKDAVRIYSRWRMAVSFRERRVKNYDKKKGEYVV